MLNILSEQRNLFVVNTFDYNYNDYNSEQQGSKPILPLFANVKL